MAVDPTRVLLGDALAAIAAGAEGRDHTLPVPPFPEASFVVLEGAGALAATVPGQGKIPYAEELALVRSVARADAAVSRILDGHLNGVERVAIHAGEPLRSAELAAVAEGVVRIGVWGADPGPGEGQPARIDGKRIHGVKTFCSGAGGVQRAIVLAREPDDAGPVRAAYVDLTAGDVEIDQSWFRGSGMRASASHRVVFHGAPVLAVLGGPSALLEQPWFARDAVRTAATWAGAADAAAGAALRFLRDRPVTGDLEALAGGRMLAAQRVIDLWLAEAGRLDRELSAADAAFARDAIAGAARTILDEAARACGSRPFALGGELDRARRDLELFVLQHRLDPIVARAGAAALNRRP